MAMELERANQGKVTFCVVFASIIASLGGFIFGYLSQFGLVAVAMENIYYDLFVWETSDINPRNFDYCKYSGRGFRFPVLSGPLYLAGSLTAILAYPLVTKLGPRRIMMYSGYVFIVGTILNAFITIAGQIIIGVGVGFWSQASMTYLTEIAPSKFRGIFTTMFQLAIAVGILVGNAIEKDFGRFGLTALIIGWGLPVIPAIFLILGAKFYLPENPSYLLAKGKTEEAQKALKRIRGTENDINNIELQTLTAAMEEFALENREKGFRAGKSILIKRNRPQLVVAILVPVFQNLTGVLFVFVYAPLLFQSMGSGTNKSGFYSAVINGAVLIVSAMLCLATIDLFGRRALLICGGVLMTLSQVIIAILLGSDITQLDKNGLSIVLTSLIAVFMMAYGFSWGPLGWSIPSEIFTLETRFVGQSVSVSINLLFTYIVIQFFIPLLCAFKFGLFLFFAGWIVVMTVFVFLFLPETKGVTIEGVGSLWTNHWFWSKYSKVSVTQTHDQEV